MINLIASEDYQSAYSKLKILEWEHAGEPTYDLLFAIVANEIGEYGEAILALERVLAIESNQTRARAK